MTDVTDKRERRRRRDSEAVAEGGGERRRRRDEEEKAAAAAAAVPDAQPQPGGEERRRRRRDEADPAGGGGGARRRRRDEAEDQATNGQHAPPPQQQQQPQTGERRPSRGVAPNSHAQPPAKPEPPAGAAAAAAGDSDTLCVSYAMFGRQRRALDQYQKRCTFAQLIEKMHTEQFMELLGGKYEDRSQAKREKERCRVDASMARETDPKGSSAGIMTEFYSTVLRWGGCPLPSKVREAIDVLERRYKTEKRAEKERLEEKARLEREAQEKEVEELQPEPEEGEEYADDFENADDDAGVDAEAEHANKMINEQMNQQYVEAKKSKAVKDRERAHARSPKREAAAAGIVLPERQGMSHDAVLKEKKRGHTYTRQYKRAQEILQLVSLDCVSYDMMEVAPVTEYDLYIRNFGNANCEQRATQVPDETEIDSLATQTDEVTMSAHGAQAPDDLGLSTHVRAPLPNARKERYRIDTAKLSSFMSNCSSVFRVLLDEGTTSLDGGVESAAYPFSTKVTTLRTAKFIGNDRGTTGVVFSRVALQYLVTTHGKAQGEADVDNATPLYDGLCVIWNINNPTIPDKVCVAGGAVTSATFSPFNGHLLYGSSANGSVYLWDLREPDYIHKRKQDKSLLVLRTPTYSTDHMSTDNHSCAIRRILPVGYNNILIGSGTGGDQDLSEQVATLDEMGNVKIWILVDVVDKRAFEKDYGLNVGGRLRLFRSATVAPAPPKLKLSGIPECPEDVVKKVEQAADTPRASARKQLAQAPGLWEDAVGAFPEVAAYDLEFQPDDASQFLIGCDGGFVLHSSRFGEKAVPSRYKSSQRRPDAIAAADSKFGVRVLSLHYAAATDNRLFLAALSDGTISVYKTGWGTPIYTLEGFTDQAVIVARWSNMHRGVVWALDAKGFVYMFDLIEDDAVKRQSPVYAHDCALTTAGKKSYPNDMDLSYDEREPKLAISYTCGRVDLHVLTDSLLRGRSASSKGDWLNSVL